jgi:hypothetical protein
MPYAHSGPARILATGTATTFGGASLVIGLEDPFPLEVALQFVTDPAVPDVAVRQVSGDERRITWELVNFDGPDGRGTADPVQVGDHPHGRIFLHFRVFRYGRSRDRTVHYTFYDVPRDGGPS